MKRIFMQPWLEANERKRTYDTDIWYVNLANKLLPVVEKSPLFHPLKETLRVQTALALSLYMQDSVAQTGGWTTFKEAYHKLYGTQLPFYVPQEDYVADEVNREDIALVLWTRLARPATHRPDDYTLQDPFDTELLRLAQSLYDILNGLFEEAPINELPSPDTWLMDIGCLKRTSTPLPDSSPQAITDKNAARCLAYSKGEPLLFFRTYSELTDFFIHTLGWEAQPEDLLPELSRHSHFILYANAKGMLIGHDVAQYFHTPHNTLYSVEETKRTGHRLFCQPGACPFDLLKYGIRRGYLNEITLPFANGQDILHGYRDFLMRYYLQEYYEGE